MKTRKVLQKYLKACVNNDQAKERKYWFKLLKKSLKGKDTRLK